MIRRDRKSAACFAGWFWLACISVAMSQERQWELSLRSQTETSLGSKRFHQIEEPAVWRSERTALIICDMWDTHPCVNAVRRVHELAPAIDRLAKSLRKANGTIIHAPSSCVAFYKDSLARKRTKAIPISDQTPDDISNWCDSIDENELVDYPIDQSDGGVDDDPVEHEQWLATLIASGRDPGQPWKRQTPMIQIDESCDYISDDGKEIWNLLRTKQIENVLLVGVHTNMCVLGRPFGLRQLIKQGFNAVLVRDLTDTMYNPASWPFVNHHSGTDLIVNHIERHVCATVESDQFVDGQAFRFASDHRPHIAILISEPEYETNRTLTEFSQLFLNQDFRVNLIYGPEPADEASQLDGIPGIQGVQDADVLLISVRRKPLPPKQLQAIKDFVASGKPVIGIRTASHAFSLRNAEPPEGLVSWGDFDSAVFGGNYTNHYKQEGYTITAVDSQHARFVDLPEEKATDFSSIGTLYRTSPLRSGTIPLLNGELIGEPAEPVAWTYMRQDGGRSFYTSLGHPADFKLLPFQQLLINAIRWSVDLPKISSQKVYELRQQHSAGVGRQR